MRTNRHVHKFAVMGFAAIAAFPFLVYGQPGGQCSPPAETAFRSMSRAEMEVMIADVAESNPAAIERLRNEPEFKKQQLDSIRDLLAYASQAVKEGLATESVNCAELSNIRDEVISSNHFVDAAKGGPKTLFREAVTAEQIADFWNGKNGTGSAQDLIKVREDRFKQFIESKLALLNRDAGGSGERSISEEERDQAREFFARMQIALNDHESGKQQIPEVVKASVQTKIKLQQAQFLARQYSEKLAGKVRAGEVEIRSFIAARPELNRDDLKAKAAGILERAKKGENFAVLADRYSQDVGNKGDDGKLNGGLYLDVGRGVMVPAFEAAALSLKPGEIYPSLVETDFGFHVIKLERKDPSAEGTYDVRHIVIDTTIPDPEDPDGRGLPVREYARRQIETEKERKLLAAITEANGITVASDFSIPGAAAKGAGPKGARPKP